MSDYKHKTSIVIYTNDDGESKTAIDWENTSQSDDNKGFVLGAALLLVMNDNKIFDQYVQVAENELKRIGEAAEAEQEDSANESE